MQGLRSIVENRTNGLANRILANHQVGLDVPYTLSRLDDNGSVPIGDSVPVIMPRKPRLRPLLRLLCP
jgi:hypothetical protein